MTTRRLVRPHAEIAFEDSGGGGLPVVLCHGAGMDRTMFAAQAAALTDAGFRVIAWDLPGHGESTLTAASRFAASDALDDLSALLDECRVDRAVLVGHSLGGNLVQAFVRANPHRTAGLIVIDSTWNAGPLAWWERLALRLAAPSLALVPAQRLPGLMARASAVTADAIARTEATFARMPKPVFLDVWRATVSFVDPDPAYRTPVPLALVRGALDRTGNIASAMPHWAKAEGVTEHVVPDAGHIVTWDAPDATSRVLVGILEEWGSAARDGS
ncbi:alpha/beta fold hydrolase [Microbacterium sp. M]|uniref:alpha/beta fold hydrolase n=1 Tax=Microbacterium sp. M TaxID=3377125 RepID=UPI00386C7AED